ncbi:MAG TPA: hypothetical protein VH599_09250 [Ktedonobacterales bacterium]
MPLVPPPSRRPGGVGWLPVPPPSLAATPPACASARSRHPVSYPAIPAPSPNWRRRALRLAV